VWLDGAVIVVVLLQTVALVLLWRQGRLRSHALVGKPETGSGVEALLIVNALAKIDDRLDAMEARLRTLSMRSPVEPSLPLPSHAAAPVSYAAPTTKNYELAQQLARDGG
jgi:hypothetical protein